MTDAYIKKFGRSKQSNHKNNFKPSSDLFHSFPPFWCLKCSDQLQATPKPAPLADNSHPGCSKTACFPLGLLSMFGEVGKQEEIQNKKMSLGVGMVVALSGAAGHAMLVKRGRLTVKKGRIAGRNITERYPWSESNRYSVYRRVVRNVVIMVPFSPP